MHPKINRQAHRLKTVIRSHRHSIFSRCFTFQVQRCCKTHNGDERPPGQPVRPGTQVLPVPVTSRPSRTLSQEFVRASQQGTEDVSQATSSFCTFRQID